MDGIGFALKEAEEKVKDLNARVQDLERENI